MPIYEYRCSACGHQLERLQRMSDAALTDCPACEKPALKRLLSPAGFRLKGSGWYETDFKKDNKRNVAEAGSDSAEKASKKDTDAKPADTKSSDSGKKDNKSASDSGKKADSTKATAA